MRGFVIVFLAVFIETSVFSDSCRSGLLESERTDRIRASLLGLAWGDIFAAPVESWSAQAIQDVFGAYAFPERIPHEKIRVTLGEKQLGWIRPLGVPTDDTQQALALIHAAFDRGPEWSDGNTAAFAGILVEGRGSDSWRGTGKFFEKALTALTRGVPYSSSGSASAGIGAAMRVGVLGALYWDDPDSLEKSTFETSLMTHSDLRAAAMSYAVAWTVASLLQGKSPESIRTRLALEVAKAESKWAKMPSWTVSDPEPHAVSMALAHMLSIPSLELSDSESRVLESARLVVHRPESLSQHPNDAYVLLGGVHALALGVLTMDAPQKVLTHIAQLGGDTDTVAAITGTILGARYGSGWIPLDHFAEPARLEAYATSLIDRRAPETVREFLVHEAQQSRAAEAFTKQFLESPQ